MSDKKIHVFAGPNGIGKSTLGEEFAKMKNINFINPEEIKRQQKSLHGDEINFRQLHSIMDIDIRVSLEKDDEIIIESNLHDIEAYRFIQSYITYYGAYSICYFHYTDDISILRKRTQGRERHLGHIVPKEMLIERYQNSFNLIIENIASFNEVHFFDNSEIDISKKTLEVLNGEINYIDEELKFSWTHSIIEKLTE
ncbi:MAG: hypothetical protein ACQETL_04370 [Bacteroidota bacterium]